MQSRKSDREQCTPFIGADQRRDVMEKMAIDQATAITTKIEELIRENTSADPDRKMDGKGSFKDGKEMDVHKSKESCEKEDDFPPKSKEACDKKDKKEGSEGSEGKETCDIDNNDRRLGNPNNIDRTKMSMMLENRSKLLETLLTTEKPIM